MKKLLLSIAVLVGLSGTVKATVIGDVFDSVVRESHLRLLDSVTAIYFYDARNGVSNKGAVSSIWEYKIITADIGYVNKFDSNASGYPLAGGSIHADKILGEFFPKLKENLWATVPTSAQNFVKMINVGYAIGHDFESNHFFHGVYSGLEYKFK